jgi:hypothetical protein
MVAAAMICVWAISAAGASAAAPQISGATVSAVTSTTAVLEADINPQGLPTTYRFEYGPGKCSLDPCTPIPVPDGDAGAGSSPKRVTATVEGLTAGTIYFFRVIADNGTQTVGPDQIFATYSGPLAGLPDARAYEQASPVDKDGGDALGVVALVKAASDGEGITFGNTFGIPGGKGAQSLPFYLASRGAGWSTQGLLPPAAFGERARVLGKLADLSETYSTVAKLGNPRTEAFLAQSTTGGPPSLISPYVVKPEYAYAGTSAGGATVLFEAEAQLPLKAGDPPNPVALKGLPNLYAWDRASGELRLASVFNDKTAPLKGAFAGPYGWAAGTSAATLREGGGSAGYYLTEEHAIAANGDAYFTAAGSGQLYLRRNPTKEQSPLDGEGKCVVPALACTIHVSASRRATPDPAGSQPAAFQAASADGSRVFFTSSEKLTEDANTGLEQPEAQIGIGAIGGGIEKEDFIPKRAIGVAVDGSHVYWADPVLGAIGRADIDGNPASVDPTFIVPGPVEFEVEGEPGIFEAVESKPRYVAVDAGHVYWTNTGRLDENEEPADDEGTIGRADIDGGEASIDPDFIRGASNPQGIAVNATHVYWANAAKSGTKRSIGRADIEGNKVVQGFFEPKGTTPFAVALSASHIYFSINEAGDDVGYLGRVALGGGEEEILGIGKRGLRGIALDATYAYWATQGEEAIGRIALADFPSAGGCEVIASCNKKLTKPKGKLNGLAADAAHLYWSVNGESPTNPGNDLYRFEAAKGPTGTLEDLTPLEGGNGAEVQGLLAASADGSQIYFAANGVLDDGEEATPGNCHGSVSSTTGSCNLYLWREGAITLVARLKGGGGASRTDSLNWAAAAQGLFGGGFAAKTSFLSEDGETLLFRSQEKLTEYENEGIPELYRYQAADGALSCVSCRPSGEAVGGGPKLGSLGFPGLSPALASVSAVASRNLSADGKRVFFETAEALSPLDVNGQAGCPPTGSSFQSFPACLDVYEWEAPGTGSCAKSGPSYSPLNEGCLYLISTGKDKFPSLLADASESGDDVFFFTRQQLVGQDKDELQDVYDARVGGGIAAQNPVAGIPCESAEACHGPAQTPPAESSPGTAGFVGPGNPVPKHKAQKQKKRKAKGQKKKQKRAHAKRGASR